MKATKNVITWCAFDSGESDRALNYYNLCAFSLSFCHLFHSRVLSDVVQSLLYLVFIYNFSCTWVSFVSSCYVSLY